MARRIRWPLMRRPRVMVLDVDDRGWYVITDAGGRKLAGTAATHLYDRATEKLWMRQHG